MWLPQPLVCSPCSVVKGLLVRTLPCLCWGHPQLTFLMLAALQQAVEVAGEKKVLQGVAGKERGMGEG